MIETLAVATLVVCLVWAAASDVATLKIPNGCSATIGAAFLVAAAAAPLGWSAFGWHALTALAALLGCFALFSFNLLGAGDGKLVALVVAWLGPAGSGDFLLMTCVVGGGLAFAQILFRAWPLPLVLMTNRLAVQLHEKGAMPYGLPIAIGAFYALSRSRWAEAVPLL